MNGISIREFEVAMETYGARRLKYTEESRYSIQIPYFIVKNTVFKHSGSYYIVQREERVPDELMNLAMAEFGEKAPGGVNFWWGEIHSIKGILTLVSMLDGKYSKELVEKLTIKTYEKLLSSEMIKENIKLPFVNTSSEKMKKLCDFLQEYNNIVNPYKNPDLTFKSPSEYIDKINIKVSENKKLKNYRLELKNSSVYVDSARDLVGWNYRSIVGIQENRKNGEIYCSHYYDYKTEDEILYVRESLGSEENVNMKLNLTTGLTWKIGKESCASPVTDEDIDIFIKYLNICINKIQKRIVKYIIQK